MESFVTMITPYDANGKIDFSAAEKYVDWYYNSGLTGIFSICQSSEIFYLSQDERTELNRIVYRRAKELERGGNRKFTVVSSGHVSDSPEKQAEELNAVYASGTDALILITNRLDPNNEGDDVFIRNAEALIAKLPSDARLGLYECPTPYKRLVTPKILEWCVKTGRFYYMKDTCCDSAVIAERCRILSGSHFRLLNANCQTLLDSMRSGADGYCGIMANFHPRLYSWICDNFEENPQKAELIQSFIGTFGFTEVGLPYPLTAKYSMNLCGQKTNVTARNRKADEFTDYVKNCVIQMKKASDYLESLL